MEGIDFGTVRSNDIPLAERVAAQISKLIPIITYSVGLFGSISGNSLRTETIIGQRSVAEAIDARDAEKAAEAMRQHLIVNMNELDEIEKAMEEKEE